MLKTNDDLVNEFISEMVAASKNKENTRYVYFVIVGFFEDCKSAKDMPLMDLALARLNTILIEKLEDLPIFLYIACLRSSFCHRQFTPTWFLLLATIGKDTSEPPERLRKLLCGLDRDNKPLCGFA